MVKSKKIFEWVMDPLKYAIRISAIKFTTNMKMKAVMLQARTIQLRDLALR